MDLVIFNDTYPPEKQAWASPNISDRGNWSWISELITTWFCYSNGIRKENNIFVIIGDIEIELRGDEIRYLAPNQRSVLSILYNAYKTYRVKSKKYQPGVYVRLFKGFQRLDEPMVELSLTNNEKLRELKIVSNVQTLLIGSERPEINKLQVFAESYNQALIWFLYS